MTIDLLTLSASFGRLVHKYSDKTSVIQVRENDKLRWLYTGGEAIQSIIELNNPQKVLLPVPKALLVAFLWLPQTSRVLNLGVGGGTIENALTQVSSIKVTSIEASSAIIDLANKYFYFPKQQPIIESCALAFLLADQQQYNLICVDLFDAERIPDFCFSSLFYNLLNNRLLGSGVVAINLHPKNEEELLNILLLNKALFSNIALIKFNHYKNIVVLLSNSFIPNTEALMLVKDNFLNINFIDIISNMVYVVNPK